MAGPTAADLARASRLLIVRSGREATGLFAGNYASAFRGGGLEFEESRPYAPGDDVSALDWNATARTGELFVKRFREERNQTLLFALDTSASMAFGTGHATKAETAGHALALLTAAAARAGDRTGLVTFDARVRHEVEVGRGGAHGLRVIRAAVVAAADPGGKTRMTAALRRLRTGTRRRSIVFLFSDFRDPELMPPPPEPPRLRAALADLTRRHDVVAVVPVDPAEEDLPRVGVLRIADPERPGRSRVLSTDRERPRRRYARAARAWRSRLERELRRCGADPLWLRTDRSPLHALGRFFHDRAARRISG